MGGGTSKSLVKKRQKEFRLSSDDENDDDDGIDDIYVHRSLYKIFSGNIFAVEKQSSIQQHRCRWCHDSHDVALSVHCLCSSERCGPNV